MGFDDGVCLNTYMTINTNRVSNEMHTTCLFFGGSRFHVPNMARLSKTLPWRRWLRQTMSSCQLRLWHLSLIAIVNVEKLQPARRGLWFHAAQLTLLSFIQVFCAHYIQCSAPKNLKPSCTFSQTFFWLISPFYFVLFQHLRRHFLIEIKMHCRRRIPLLKKQMLYVVGQKND